MFKVCARALCEREREKRESCACVERVSECLGDVLWGGISWHRTCAFSRRSLLVLQASCCFQYSGDQDDKQWLHEHHHMPASGGKAYLLLVEDVRELAETDEYKWVLHLRPPNRDECNSVTTQNLQQPLFPVCIKFLVR